MVTKAPSRSAIAVAVLFALSCVTLIIYVWTQFGGTLPLAPKGYRFHAAFAQASQLTPNADVRMAGVNVGKVVGVSRRRLLSDATIQLEAQYAPLASDARAILRQKTLLGETFISLTPGSRGAHRIGDGGRLAASQVQDTQQLDTVLGTLDPPTQRNLQRLLGGLSAALEGRGGDLNSALGNADPTLSTLDSVVTIVDRQQPSFQRLIRDTATVLQTLGARRGALRTLVGAGDQVLSATAMRNRELTATVRALPGFLKQLKLTLGAAEQTAGLAGPSLAALRPVAPLVRPALTQLITLAPAIQALMRDIGPLISTSSEALPAATRIVNATVPFVDQLLPTAQQVTPLIELTKLYATPISAVFANLAATFQATTPAADGSPIHYLRALIPNSNESITAAARRFGSNRHNPYPAPDVLTGVGNGGIAASDCRNTSNPSPAPANPPTCHVQAPLPFGATSSYYPQIKPLGKP